MKKGYIILKVTTFSLCFILLASTFVAFAANTVLLSYSGLGIRSKASVNNFKLAKETVITIDHNQTVNPAYQMRESQCSMKVSLQKKGAIFYSDTGDSVTTYGSSGFRKSYTKSSGTYRLYFASIPLADETWPSYDINGTVK